MLFSETQLKKLASVLGLDYWKLTDLKPEPPKEVKSKTAKSNPRPTNDSKNVSGSKNDPESTTDSEIEPRSTPVDPNYVLTYDNVIKILAIVLRFRYGIARNLLNCVIICLSQMQNTCCNNGRNWMWKNTTP